MRRSDSAPRTTDPSRVKRFEIRAFAPDSRPARRTQSHGGDARDDSLVKPVAGALHWLNDHAPRRLRWFPSGSRGREDRAHDPRRAHRVDLCALARRAAGDAASRIVRAGDARLRASRRSRKRSGWRRGERRCGRHRASRSKRRARTRGRVRRSEWKRARAGTRAGTRKWRRKWTRADAGARKYGSARTHSESRNAVRPARAPALVTAFFVTTFFVTTRR